MRRPNDGTDRQTDRRTPGQLSLASLRGRLIQYQLGWGKGGNVTSAGWQVTLCDSVWHVSSRSGVATLRTAIHLLLTYLLTYLPGRYVDRAVHTIRAVLTICDSSIVSSALRCKCCSKAGWNNCKLRKTRDATGGSERLVHRARIRTELRCANWSV